MATVFVVTDKGLKQHLGATPVFDPRKPREPQVEEWIGWSAKKRMVDRFIDDQEARNENKDPDEGR